MTLYIKYIMTTHKTKYQNFYQQIGLPGVRGGMKPCVDWKSFREKYSPTETLRGDNFRFLLLILGPTGSGKTAVIDYLKRYATLINNKGIRAGGPWVQDEVNYDQIITQNPDYRTQFNEISRDVTPEDADAADKMADGLQEAYKTIRHGPIPLRWQADPRKYIHKRRSLGFGTPGTLRQTAKHRRKLKMSKEDATDAPDIVVYKQLRRSISEGRNIVFESTGEHWDTLKMIFQTLVFATRSCTTYKYIILAGVNIINLEENQHRILTRFQQQFTQYHQDPANNPVPRLPHPGSTVLQPKRDNIYRNIQTLIQLCTTVQTKNTEEASTVGQCPGVGIDILFIFDQNRYDWRNGADIASPETPQTIFPSAIIPLSKRSAHITTYTKNESLKFPAKTRTLVNNLLQGRQDVSVHATDSITEGMRKHAIRAKLQNILRVKKKSRSGRKGGRRSKRRRKTIRRRRRKRRKTRRRKRKQTR